MGFQIVIIIIAPCEGLLCKSSPCETVINVVANDFPHWSVNQRGVGQDGLFVDAVLLFQTALLFQIGVIPQQLVSTCVHKDIERMNFFRGGFRGTCRKNLTYHRKMRRERGKRAR